MAAQAAPNRKEKTTICSTSLRAMASMMLAGKTCSSTVRERGLRRAAAPASAARAARSVTPVAGPHQIDRAEPEEQRDGRDDFEIDDRLERRCGPCVFRSPPPAMPYTSVPNSSGAMIDRISRRNTLLTGASCFATSGRERRPARCPPPCR